VSDNFARLFCREAVNQSAGAVITEVSRGSALHSDQHVYCERCPNVWRSAYLPRAWAEAAVSSPLAPAKLDLLAQNGVSDQLNLFSDAPKNLV